jgi:hypothetical protein
MSSSARQEATNHSTGDLTNSYFGFASKFDLAAAVIAG